MPRWPRPQNLTRLFVGQHIINGVSVGLGRRRGRSRRFHDFRLRRRSASDARRNIGQHLRSSGALAREGANADLRLCAGDALDCCDPNRASLGSGGAPHDRRNQLCRRSRHRARAMGGGGRHAGRHPDGVHSGVPARNLSGCGSHRDAAPRRWRRLYRDCALGDRLHRP